MGNGKWEMGNGKWACRKQITMRRSHATFQQSTGLRTTVNYGVATCAGGLHGHFFLILRCPAVAAYRHQTREIGPRCLDDPGADRAILTKGTSMEPSNHLCLARALNQNSNSPLLSRAKSSTYQFHASLSQPYICKSIHPNPITPLHQFSQIMSGSTLLIILQCSIALSF